MGVVREGAAFEADVWASNVTADPSAKPIQVARKSLLALPPANDERYCPPKVPYAERGASPL